MPVSKYISFEEAEKALWNFNPDQAYYDKVAFILKSGCDLVQTKYKPGIYKFKSIRDANKFIDAEILRQAGKRLRIK